MFENDTPPTLSGLATTSMALAGEALDVLEEPVLLLDSQDGVLAGNAAAEGLAGAWRAGTEPELAAMVTEARRSGCPAWQRTGGGGTSPLSLAILPLDEPAGGVLLLGRDLGMDHSLREALVESRQRYKDLVGAASDAVWEVAADGTFAFVSAQGMLGWQTEELVGRLPEHFFLDAATEVRSPFAPAQPVKDAEIWMRRADGAPACLAVSGKPLYGADGAWRGARGVMRDVTEERERDAALARAHARERILNRIVGTFRGEPDVNRMPMVAAEAVTLGMAADGCRIFRVREAGEDASPEALVPEIYHGTALDSGGEEDLRAAVAKLGTKPAAWVDDRGRRLLGVTTTFSGRINGALVLWRAAERPGWSDEDHLLLDEVAHQVAVAHEQIDGHERVLHLSRTDPLTGLLNRRAFFDDLDRRFRRAARGGAPSALLYVDLDNFKLTNDVHGHEAGDRALMAVCELLHAHSRPADLVARLGGDEFALWLEGMDADTARQRAADLVGGADALARFSGSEEHPLQVSVGVALHEPAAAENLDDLINRADRAMYAAKRKGKGSYVMATPFAGEGA